VEGITQRQMDDYAIVWGDKTNAHFLGQYLPWDSHRNAAVAIGAGMDYKLPSTANWWRWENLDNSQTGIHDHMMYRKFGFGRFCSQISVDVRRGELTRGEAMMLVEQFDWRFPEFYNGVHIDEVLDRIGMTRPELNRVMDSFTNWDIMRRVDDSENAVPVLI
jgi:hypothetical protein